MVVAAVGFTRVALGVHFLSDVIGGWLLGLAWISVTAYAFRIWRREAGARRVLATHGNSDALVRVLRERGLDARALRTELGGED